MFHISIVQERAVACDFMNLFVRDPQYGIHNNHWHEIFTQYDQSLKEYVWSYRVCD